MNHIKQLSDDLIKKIAAGEVIERPASVVKELVENAIDAHSTKINIEVQRSGKYIKVSDNGDGILSSDVELLFKKHATSKLSSLEDLWDIHSLGFRGEALASISSISKTKCFSKHRDENIGFEVSIIDEKINKKSNNISLGTIFEIDDLFYNVPAREKFLKSEQTEIDHIYNVVLGLALSHPEISFSFKKNNNILLSSSGSGNLELTISELLGNDLRNNLIFISTSNHFCNINGYISSLDVFRSDKKSIFTFVNGRAIKCPLLQKCTNSAFEGLLPPGKFPIIVLNLNFKPKFIDVNVHPTKKEVRYTHPNEVYNLLLRTLQDSISKHYKKIYKENSAYTLPSVSSEVNIPETSTVQNSLFSTEKKSYATEALNLYKNISPTNDTVEEDSSCRNDIAELLLFSANNIKCKKIISDKPLNNITKIGNKSIFEYGIIFEKNIQIIFSGEINGDESYQKEFFNSLYELAVKVLQQTENKNLIQGKFIFEELNLDEDNLINNKNRKKPPDETLYKVWERDNWTCVYCGKQLLDPKVVKSSISRINSAFIKYINNDGKEITSHILREYIATYDHFIPVSKLPQFNFDEENLFTSCISCNMKKSDSMNLKTWVPCRKNNWEGKSLQISNLIFKSPNSLIFS